MTDSDNSRNETFQVEWIPGFAVDVPKKTIQIDVRNGPIEGVYRSEGENNISWGVLFIWLSTKNGTPGQTFRYSNTNAWLQQLVEFAGSNDQTVPPPEGHTYTVTKRVDGDELHVTLAYGHLWVPKKLIIFDFVGGPLDGESLSSNTIDESMSQTLHGAYHLTNCGEVGRAYMGMSPALFDLLKQGQIDLKGMFHKYLVEGRDETDSEVLIRFRYLNSPMDDPPAPTATD
jgi:hypothetical protein